MTSLIINHQGKQVAEFDLESNSLINNGTNVIDFPDLQVNGLCITSDCYNCLETKCSDVQCNQVHYTQVQCSNIQCTQVKCNQVKCNTVRCSTKNCSYCDCDCSYSNDCRDDAN